MNGHAGVVRSSRRPRARRTRRSGRVHEDVWANATEVAGEEMFEDMLTENPAQEIGAFEHTATEFPSEYAQPEASPYGELPYEQGAQEESAFETPWSEDTTFEDTSFEDTSFEDTTFEDTSFESIHAANESAYEDTSQEEADESAITAEWAAEDTGYEQTGYEQTGYEDVGYESLALENGVTETHESGEYATESAGALNPELLEWPGEIYAEDWAASGEASASVESRFGIAEHVPQEGPGAQVPAGERTVSNHPLLRAHRGTQPDLVVRWNAMPRSTTTVDVVVHLHGYSGSGARMKIQDKAAASGVVLGGGRARPTLGLVPRGNFFGGQSGAGYNFPELVTPGAINRLVASGLDLLRAQTGVQATLGRLILTAHSGGGAPLNAILRHTDADEVHLFDGSYGDMANVVAWAKRRIARGASESALRVLFRPGSGTERHALAIAAGICPTISASPDAAAAHRRFRVEATSVEHNLIPPTFGPLLLADPGADLPGAVRRGCVHGGPAPSPAPTATPVRAGDQPVDDPDAGPRRRHRQGDPVREGRHAHAARCRGARGPVAPSHRSKSGHLRPAEHLVRGAVDPQRGSSDRLLRTRVQAGGGGAGGGVHPAGSWPTPSSSRWPPSSGTGTSGHGRDARRAGGAT